MFIAAAFGLGIGLVVGTVGGGGAVLAVPVLVYMLGLDVHAATTASLAVVGAAALTGAVGQARRRAVCWRAAAWFALAASVGTIAGTAANRVVGGPALLLVFAGVMVLAAAAMWQRAGSPAPEAHGCPQARLVVLLAAGVTVGALTGFVGIGGGFVMVPALALGLSFGMREAMGTSIVIVAIVAVAGLLAHLLAGNALDVRAAAAMSAGAVAGAIAGPHVGDRVSPRALAHAFSLLIVAVAAGVAGATVAGVTV